MQFGHFDLENKEYVITRPDTPAPWCNYLGSPAYGAIISNNAFGYSFVKSGANGRITRYRFNDTQALPGRFIYIRDNADGDYWSASWQPVGKDLSTYKNVCRHGTAYTVISAQYRDIASDVTYYVPKDKTYEVWAAKVTNEGKTERKLSTFGFVEFTNENNYEQDQVNLQYTLFISRTSFEGNKIVQHINENSERDAKGSNHAERFFGLANAKVSDFAGSLADFVGPYRTFANPQAVETGKCGGKLNYNQNSCGALQSDFTLAPGETKTFIYALGHYNNEEAEEILAGYKDYSVVEKEVAELKAYWHAKLDNFKVNTPSPEFNNMVNVWNAYNCFITFTWSRAASLIYCGQRNGYGYRDTVQDIQGIIHLDPQMAAEQIRFMISAQVDNGAGLPLVKYDHNAGHEDTPDDESYVRETGHPSYRADDALWLFPTVYKYVTETGDTAFLDEEIPYANKGKDTVYGHLKRAIDFSMNHMGAHNMPAGLHADWNDCLRLGAKGESTFVAFQLYYALDMMLEIAGAKGDSEYIKFLNEVKEKLSRTLSTCWDEDRFIRGIREDGVVVGAKKDPEANMWLNPQSWAIISNFATKEQAKTSMDSVERILDTPYGAKLLEPPYIDHAFPGALMHIFNPDTKENGGIFSQSQGWLILAESLLGEGERAFKYFLESSPASMNEKAEQRVLEPYVHGQFVESTRSPFAGRTNVHWLTGTASTVMVGCVEGICGMRPTPEGLVISPAVPKAWKEFTMEKTFRGKKLYITVKNPNGAESGARKVTVNGKEIEGNLIRPEDLKAENTVEVEM